MTMGSGDFAALPAMLAKLHRDSISPNGKFGFQVPTYHGLLAQDNRWAGSWEQFFADALNQSLMLDQEVNGPSDELQKLSRIIFQTVIPRLLGPLEIEGRLLKPCLIHGDLWRGNFALRALSNEPVAFDACAFWGHNECMSFSLLLSQYLEILGQ